MQVHKDLINTFYTAFQNKDYETIKGCYHPEATFSDEVFLNLNAKETGMMWEMLIRAGEDLRLEFKDVEADGQKGKATWVPTYTFGKTGRKVINHIQAEFIFKDGKIFKHRDYFDFHKWSKQALGTPGILLGWTGFLKNKVRDNARQRLDSFIQKNG